MHKCSMYGLGMREEGRDADFISKIKVLLIYICVLFNF